MTGWRSLLGRSAWLAAVVVAGCSGVHQVTPPGTDPPGAYVALTEPVIMLGDTQEHEATGFPLADNDSAIDAYVEVAQRPAEQPLFGRRILEWVLENHAGEPVIHLGDVMDVSCRSEGERLARIMAAAKQEGAILPGNHDGLMFGIFNYDAGAISRDRDGARWDRACRRAAYVDGDPDKPAGRGGAFTKKDFIVSYLEGVAAKLPAGAGPVLPAGSDEWRLAWRNPRRAPLIEEIHAVVTPAQRFARSFLAQKLKLPRAPGSPRGVSIVALDTNQIDAIVGALDAFRGISPGNVGHVQPNQIDVAKAWVAAARAAGDLVVFAGHHDWASLGPETKRRLAEVMRGVDHPLVYFSAHTHSGFWGSHHVAGRTLLELNVSSLSDWPIAYRRVAIQFDERANRIKVVGDLMPQAGTPGRGDTGAGDSRRTARDDADLLHMWERMTCARSGVPMTVISRRDMNLVRLQRDGRGSLFAWLQAWLGGDDCEECVETLYRHAHGYLDLMLIAIKNTALDLDREVPELKRMRLPSTCAGRALGGCIDSLVEQKPVGLQAVTASFRVKASLIDRANSILDDEGSPRAKAYMTCRAVQAAKDDYDMTDPGAISWRTEATRRAGEFFRLEATVGMEPPGVAPSPMFTRPTRANDRVRPSTGRAGRP